jgi:hypothetical protein
LVEQNVGNIIFVCYFLNIGLGPKTSQYFRHLFEKSIPGPFYSKPHRKVNATTLELSATHFKNRKKKTTNPFPNLDFFVKAGLPNIDFPWIVFPWRPEAEKKCGGCGGGGSPPHEEAQEAREARRPEKRADPRSAQARPRSADLASDCPIALKQFEFSLKQFLH